MSNREVRSAGTAEERLCEAVIGKPGNAPSDFNSQTLELRRKMNFCCLNHPVCGSLLGQPEQTETLGILTQHVES